MATTAFRSVDGDSSASIRREECVPDELKRVAVRTSLDHSILHPSITALRRPLTPPDLGKEGERELTGGYPAKGIRPKKPEYNGCAWRRSHQPESQDEAIGNLHPALLGISTSANMEA